MQAISTGQCMRSNGVELTLVLTNNCNFDCCYCFAKDLYQNGKTVDSGGIVTTVSQFLQLSDKPVSSLILFGGEPLIAFDAINTAWSEVARLLMSHQPEMPSLAIVTNGSLVDDAVAEFLSDHNFNVTVSLDGPRNVHDACRPRRVSGPSYDVVVGGIRKLRRAGVHFSTQATYTSRHLAAEVSVIDIVDHALDLGAEETHVMPAFPASASGIANSQHETVTTMFGEAARRAAKRYLESQSTELYYAVNVAYAFAHDRPRQYICGAGIDKFTVMTNGDIVPCYLVCGHEHQVGSTQRLTPAEVLRKPLEEAATRYSGLLRSQLSGCSDCWASDWCFSCYGPSYLSYRKLGAPGGLECAVYKAMAEAALSECAAFLFDRRRVSQLSIKDQRGAEPAPPGLPSIEEESPSAK
ncbi:MAG: radical SAM protein [Terracidiphilus sp.]